MLNVPSMFRTRFRFPVEEDEGTSSSLLSIGSAVAAVNGRVAFSGVMSTRLPRRFESQVKVGNSADALNNSSHGVYIQRKTLAIAYAAYSPSAEHQ
jgi:hypothetical protein